MGRLPTAASRSAPPVPRPYEVPVRSWAVAIVSFEVPCLTKAFKYAWIEYWPISPFTSEIAIV